MGHAASEPASGLECLDVASSHSLFRRRALRHVDRVPEHIRGTGLGIQDVPIHPDASVPSFRTTRITPLSCARSRMRER